VSQVLDSDELGFVPRKRLRWLSVGLLLHTAKAVVMSTAFGNFVDRRELEAIRPTDPDTLDIVDLSDRPEVWVDYVSDPGDSFDATVAIAALAGRTEPLRLDGPGDAHAQIPPCRLLVLGGDEAYPIGSRDNYRDCLRGPYRSTSTEFDEDRVMLAIPGNHDWYDGLVSFIRTFCQQRRIGGWQTRQRRSYFAVRLPHNWWLWGIDIQLDEDIDEPQLDYFAAVAGKLEAGAGIILCWAKPAWIETTPADPTPYAQIEYFERRVVPPHAEIRIALSGDSHHYVRYENPETGSQKITAGGGGAYLAATHKLPETLRLPDDTERSAGGRAEPKFVSYRRRARFPSGRDSRRLSHQLLTRPWRMFGNRTFYLIPALVYLFAARAVNDAERVFVERQAGQPFTLQPLIVCALTLVVITAGLHAFAMDTRRTSSWRRWLATVGHLLLHLVVLTTLIWFVQTYPRLVTPEPVAVAAIAVAVGLVVVPLAGLVAADKLWPRPSRMVWTAAVVVGLTCAITGLALAIGAGSNQFATVRPQTMLSVLAFVVGAAVGPLVVAFYLVAAGNRLSVNLNEQFAAQAVPDFKSFLALRVSAAGVDIHPVGVRRVPRWRRLPTTVGELKAGLRGPRRPEPTLIEPPISVTRDVHRSTDTLTRTADAQA
jgi:hypothetical protein